MADAPEIGTARIGDIDQYEGRAVIETFNFHGTRSEPWWAVPAWEETYYPELAGPFETYGRAHLALRDARRAGYRG